MFASPTIAKARPARLMGLRISMRDLCHGSTGAGGVLSVSMLNLGCLGFLGLFHAGFGSLSGTLHQSRMVQSVLFAVVVQCHFAVPPGPVHRIDIGIEEHLIEVP